MQRSRIAPTTSVLREVGLHNTLESPCPDGNTWAPPSFAAPRLPLAAWPELLCPFWVLVFPSCLAFGPYWVGMIVVLLGLCVLVP
jgi:hypothetical protein